MTLCGNSGEEALRYPSELTDMYRSEGAGLLLLTRSSSLFFLDLEQTSDMVSDQCSKYMKHKGRQIASKRAKHGLFGLLLCTGTMLVPLLVKLGRLSICSRRFSTYDALLSALTSRLHASLPIIPTRKTSFYEHTNHMTVTTKYDVFVPSP